MDGSLEHRRLQICRDALPQDGMISSLPARPALNICKHVLLVHDYMILTFFELALFAQPSQPLMPYTVTWGLTVLTGDAPGQTVKTIAERIQRLGLEGRHQVEGIQPGASDSE